MKIKTTKLFGIKIWETVVLEEGDKLPTKLKRVRQEGAVIDFTAEDEAEELRKQNER